MPRIAHHHARLKGVARSCLEAAPVLGRAQCIVRRPRNIVNDIMRVWSSARRWT
jgi:hypothetical protein